MTNVAEKLKFALGCIENTDRKRRLSQGHKKSGLCSRDVNHVSFLDMLSYKINENNVGTEKNSGNQLFVFFFYNIWYSSKQQFNCTVFTFILMCLSSFNFAMPGWFSGERVRLRTWWL